MLVATLRRVSVFCCMTSLLVGCAGATASEPATPAAAGAAVGAVVATALPGVTVGPIRATAAPPPARTATAAPPSNIQTTTEPTSAATTPPVASGVLALPRGAVPQRLEAVMLDNHPNAYPQTGMDKAPLVFEALAEFGITRYMAVFAPGISPVAKVIGPVRSARSYFVQWAMERRLCSRRRLARWAKSGPKCR